LSFREAECFRHVNQVFQDLRFIIEWQSLLVFSCWILLLLAVLTLCFIWHCECLICICSPITLQSRLLADIARLCKRWIMLIQFWQVCTWWSCQSSWVSLTWTIAAEQILLLPEEIILQIHLFDFLFKLLMQLFVKHLFEIVFKF